MFYLISGYNGIKDVVDYKWAYTERTKSRIISKVKWLTMHNRDYDLAVLCLWILFVIIWCVVLC